MGLERWGRVSYNMKESGIGGAWQINLRWEISLLDLFTPSFVLLSGCCVNFRSLDVLATLDWRGWLLLVYPRIIPEIHVLLPSIWPIDHGKS